MYSRLGSFKGVENEEAEWELVCNSTVVGKGSDQATTLLDGNWDPVVVSRGEKRSFYIAFDGPYVRYSPLEDKLYYINHDMIIYGKGVAKRKGWDGGLIAERVFNGGVKYALGNETVEVVAGNIVGLPTVAPTVVRPWIC